jgi:hypothetical protein
MADITMCKGGENNKCNTCYRKQAVPNEYRQSYFIQSPMLNDGTCSEYWNHELSAKYPSEPKEPKYC